MITLAIRIEIMLIMALFVVASDHGNFLLRKQLIKAFPVHKIKEYIKEMTIVSIKFCTVFSSVKTKKKNIDVASDIQHKVKKSLRFIIDFSCLTIRL